MRVLVLGGAGMLGHKLCQGLAQDHEVWATVRRQPGEYSQWQLCAPERLIGSVDATSYDDLLRLWERVRPEAVINAVGIVKQLDDAKQPIPSITINALLPHRLAALCAATGARFLHISTDCVFSGRAGHYTEQDMPDAEDLYGRSKLLGETEAAGALTLRTSIIGRELSGSHGLVEWFFGQRGKTVRGYRRAIYTGLTTLAFTAVINQILLHYPTLQGLYHLASSPISKYELLCLIRDRFGLDIAITPDDEVVCDRSLSAVQLLSTTHIEVPSWQAMIAAMHGDPTPYDSLRGMPNAS